MSIRTVGEIEDTKRLLALLKKATDQQERIIELLEILISNQKSNNETN